MIFNLFKNTLLGNWVLEIFCSEIVVNHYYLLHHSEIPWFLEEKVLSTAYELTNEIHIFSCKRIPFGKYFYRCHMGNKFGYLADIFSILNKFNLKLQGKPMLYFNTSNVSKKFQKMLWQARLKNSHTSCYVFPTLL